MKLLYVATLCNPNLCTYNPQLPLQHLCSYIEDMNDKTAILDVNGANCASCAYAIEHLGRKIQGVTDIKVDAAHQEIHVRYEGNPGSLERISEVVRRLGYEAKVRWDSVR
jgi:copper chaperone CopZ